MEEYKFPDDLEKEKPQEENLEVELEGATEIEIVDDTPEADRGREPMTDPPTEVNEDELSQYSEGVKKRIQHFSKGYHEERRAKEAAFREKEEAIRLAQNLLEENKRLQGNLGQGQQALIEQAKKVIAAELEEAKRKFKHAYETGDADALIAAQDELTAVKIKSDKVNNFKPTVANPPASVVQSAPKPVEQPQIDDKVRAWQQANPWFGSDEEMTAVALAVHRKLVESGVDTSSDKYYEKINSRVRQLFPDAFTSEKTVKKPSVVAPASRSTASKKIVLTKSAVNLAKRFGLTPEQYAREVSKLERNQNG